MYRVYCNNSPLYDLRDEDLVLISPIVKIGENTAGSFEFSILPKHPHYEEVNELTSVITAYDGDEEIFCGRVVEITKDLYNRKKVICEGELAYFNDSIQRPARYQGLTVRGYLETLVNIHNQQVKNQGIDKTFKVGAVTVQDNNDYVYKYTNWESTLEVIKTDLLKTYGGYLRIRKENGVRYLDYLADYPNTNTQVIEFGSNLLDFTHDMVASDIVTAVIPLGARLEDVTEVEGLDAYLTIKDVNGGVDYVYSQEAVKSYGWIFKTVKWDDVHVADNLLKKGKEYLSDIQFAQITLTVSAIDLHMLHVDMERIKVLDRIRVTSTPNGLDRFFPVSEMTIYLDKPSNNKLTLGTSYSKNSLSTKTESNITSIKDKIEELPKKSEILEEAKPILEKEGYDLEVTVFDDYVRPNEVVESGEFDANYFQHIPYLDQFNEEKGTHLVNAGGIHYEPFGIYPGTKDSLDDLEDGDSIAVPNDTTNEARALLLLQDNGIITLKDGAGLNATVKDIAENPHNVEIVELEAAQVARVTGETAYVVLNGNYALEAGFSVGKDALAYEKSDSEAAKTYVNVIAVKEGNENSDKIKALVDVLKSDEIKDFINEKYDGAVIPFDDSADTEDAAAEETDSKDTDSKDEVKEDTAEENAETTEAAEDAE